MLYIPIAIIIAFTVKGLSLYVARTTTIKVGKNIEEEIQVTLSEAMLNADVELLENKHSGKFISHLIYDIGLINNLVSTAVLNLMKDSLTLIGLLFVMFYQNWRLALFAIIMIPLASFAAKSLGKRIRKVTTEAQEKAGELLSYLSEILKNFKIIKIFQKENFELERAKIFIKKVKEKGQKIAIVLVRATPDYGDFNRNYDSWFDCVFRNAGKSRNPGNKQLFFLSRCDDAFLSTGKIFSHN